MDAANLSPAALAANVIVVGTVVVAPDGGPAVLRPEAFLRGSARRDDIALTTAGRADCALAKFTPGARVLAFLGGEDGMLWWPGPTQVWVLDGGQARSESGDTRPEATLVNQIRALTGQYAVPAGGAGEGASLDWSGTVIPVGAALLVVLGLALVLMRLWHRIDPS